MIHLGASEHELHTQRKFLESYYVNKERQLVDRVESATRFEELKREVIDEEDVKVHSRRPPPHPFISSNLFLLVDCRI